MSDPWNQDGGLDEDDYVEGIDDEDDELGVDFHTPLEDVPEPEPPRQLPARARAPRPVSRPNKGQGPKKFRIRAMSPRMAARSKGVASILVTKDDGSQVLLVRKG